MALQLATAAWRMDVMAPVSDWKSLVRTSSSRSCQLLSPAMALRLTRGYCCWGWCLSFCNCCGRRGRPCGIAGGMQHRHKAGGW